MGIKDFFSKFGRLILVTVLSVIAIVSLITGIIMLYKGIDSLHIVTSLIVCVLSLVGVVFLTIKRLIAVIVKTIKEK